MASSFPVPFDLAEQLRQRQLLQGMQNLPQGGLGIQNTPQGQQMSQVNPLAMARSDYRDALEQPAPQLSQYHPSTGRRILGGVLGAIAGMHDPKSGGEAANDIINGPFERQLSDYQQNLAQKKAAFEAENSAASEDIKAQELLAQKSAEEERAGAEKARRHQIEYEMSPEGIKEKENLYRIEHPNATKDPIATEFVKVTLKNGETVNAEKQIDKQGNASYSYLDKDGKRQFIGLDAVDKVNPLESKEPITKEPKPTNEEQDLNSFAKSIGKKPEELTFEDRLTYQRKLAQAKQTPELAQSRTTGNIDRAQQVVQSAYNNTTAQLDKDYQNLDSGRRNLDSLETLLSQGNAVSDAQAFPKLVQSILSGSTGFRMTQAEINQAVGGRTVWEALQSTINKFKAGQSPQIPPEQRAAMQKLASAFRAKIEARLNLNNKYLNMAAKEQDPVKIRGLLSTYRDELSKLEQEQNKSDFKDTTLEELQAEKKRREQNAK